MQSTGISRTLETIAEFNEGWPSGIAVSRSGRIFVSFPRTDDPQQKITLGEVRDGRVTPFPDDLTEFTSVHGIHMGPANRLFVIDTGSNTLDGCDPARAALVLIDLDRNAVVRRFTFAHDVVLPTSYCNDVVIDYNRGVSGTAYISDSGPKGPNGIICLDLDTGRSWRRLSGHASVRGGGTGGGFAISAEGVSLAPSSVGIDGITLSPDGAWVYYTPLSGYGFFRVRSAMLADTTLPDDRVAASVETLQGRDFACDGLDCDREGRIYFTDVSNNAIRRFLPAEDRYETILSSERLIWPDAVALGPDRIIYVTSSQVNRTPQMTGGQDRRERPFRLFRAASDADPATY